MPSAPDRISRQLFLAALVAFGCLCGNTTLSQTRPAGAPSPTLKPLSLLQPLSAIQIAAPEDKENSFSLRKIWPSTSEFSTEVAVAWFKLQLKLAKETPGFSPPVASRAFGYAGVTVYEALVPGMPTHQSLAGQLNGLTAMPQPAVDEEYYWPTVVNSALATISQRLFVKATPLNLAAMAALEEKYNRQFQARLAPEVFNRSMAWGKTVAEAIFAWSRNDGGNKGYSNNFPFTYTPPTGRGLWTPTPPFLETLYPSRAMQPYWGKNRPFVLKAGSDCAPPAHPAYSEQPGSAFYAEALEVYTTTKNLTAEQRAIADFWADNPGQSSTPPGHSISILNQILEQKNATLDMAAEAYAKVGMAVADAFIACWHAKYEYNLLRPITYINQFIDANWKPPINTPPFPEFPSGHSVQSGAFGQVMTDMFGEMAFVDHTHDAGAIEQMMNDLFGAVRYLGQEHHGRALAPRRFNSFFDAANEAAISRLYGGIHYRAAIENGLAQGKCIGQKISALQFKKSSVQYSVTSDQSSVISKQYSVTRIQQSSTSNEQQATSNQQHFTAAFQINLTQKVATVKPLSRVPRGDEFAQQAVVAEETAVTDLIRLRTSNVQFDAQNKIFSFEATLTNISGQLVFTPIRTVISKLRPGTVRVLNADGGGNGNGAFYNFTEFVGLDKLLRPNETSTSRNWQFFTPQVQQFSFTITVEGELQRTTAPPAPIVTRPTSPTNLLSIQVTGTADPNVQIEIVSDEGPITATANAAGAFMATVNLEANHNNRLFATAINNFGRSAPALIEVIHDAQPPVFFIDVPTDSASLTNATIAVTGRVSDMLSGFMGLRVTVNGQPANVVTGIGTNGTFERQNVALTVDVFNPITVVATDALGNSVTKRINVKRITPTGPQMVIVSGNGQAARINTQLPQPIIVKVTQPNGSPFSNKVVTFDVTRSDGRLARTTPVRGDTLMLQVRTNPDGLATVYWKLGSDAGQGNNRVSATSTSIAGTILFCASARPNPATQINIGSGNNQRVEAGGPAQEPLRVWVNDGMNGVANVPVTFTVTQGGGKVADGASSVTVNTEATGHAEVNFNLGPEGGNNVVEANFSGNTGGPATFVIYGIARTGQPTSFTGLVLDNANQPIRGATCVLKINGVTLTQDTTDATGHFLFTNIPSGTGSLYVDGLTATAVNGRSIPPGSFPFLQFEAVVVPNAENSLSTPILLPPLNPNNARIYDGTKDVELTVEGIDGLKMIIKKGSMKRADGSIPSTTDPAIVSLNQVHFDKIPMPMPDGVAPPYSGTLQPAGATFDPPVQIIFPNMTGQPPGSTGYFLSFDHDTHRFEIVATGRISADGFSFVSDPGSGISEAGWGGPGPPPPPAVINGNNNKEPKKNCEDDPLDPVYLFSGEFYLTAQDLHIKGRDMDFIWERKYRSKIALNTAQGNQWDYSYNIFIQAEGNAIRFCDGNTRNDLFLPQTDSTWSRGEYFDEFVKHGDSSYSFVMADRAEWRFNPLDSSLAAGKIASMTDRNGNRMTFHYDVQGRLVRITDTLDRDILIAYNDDGFITTITDFASRIVKYAYYDSAETGGSFGDLKSVTTPAVTGTPNGNDFPNGKTTSYTYSNGFANDALNHNLLTITDGRRNDPKDPTFGMGPYLVNVYATTQNLTDIDFDRVTRQFWGGDTIDVVYVNQTPSPTNSKAVLKVIVNDRVGHVKEYFYDVRNREILRREYTGRADPTRPTTETNNRPQGKLRPTDPDFFEIRNDYNFDALTTNNIDPNGNSTENVYERDLNPNAPTRSRGNLRMIRRMPGPNSPPGDQNIITESFEYDSTRGGCCGYNFVTKHTDGRGNISSYDYDARGNLIHRQERIAGIVEDYVYNGFGQRTAQVHPDNGSSHRRRDVFTYYDSGPQRGYLRQEIVEAQNLALTTSYEYDRVGNVIRKIDPRGHDTQYAVNALDQVVRELSREVRNGSGVRYQTDTFYDANDNMRHREVKNLDEQGRIVQSNAFFTTTFEYEILNNQTRITEEVDSLNAIVTEYGYDNNRNRTLVRYGEAVSGNQPTNVTATIYDERDLKFQEIRGAGDPQHSTTQYDYDYFGNLLATRVGIESTPRVFTNLYDGYNRLISVADPMGNVTTYNFDASGNLNRVRLLGELLDIPGGAGNVRLKEESYGYDAMNRVTSIASAFFDTDSQTPIDDGLASRQSLYNGLSLITAQIDDNHHKMLTTYDTANRIATVTDCKGNTTTLTYDANNNMIVSTQVERSDLGRPSETFVTTYEYDNLDRLIKSTDNAGNVHEYGYDSRSNLTMRRDALRSSPNASGNRTKMEYDGLNRLLKTTRYLTSDGTGSGAVIDSIVTAQTWDRSLRLISQTDDNGNTTRYVYDPLNRKTATIYADGTRSTTTYDVHDNALTMTDPNGTVTASVYDLGNRVISKTITRAPGVLGTSFERFQYDGRSRMISAVDDDAQISRSYNSLSNVTRETLNGETTTAIYDGVGNMRGCTYPGGRNLVIAYDELDRDSVMVDQYGFMAKYFYAGPGRVEQRDFANRTRTSFQYDTARRLTNTTHTFIPNVGTPVDFDLRRYTWDQMYNKTSRVDLRPGGLAQNYAYDSAYRLIRSDRGLAGNPTTTINYALDGAGNRTNVTGGPDAGAYVLNSQQPEPADFAMNQYTTTPFDRRAYDRDGNLLGLDAGLPGQRSFVYDYRNQIIEYRDNAAGSVTQYSYDPLGRRTAKVVTRGATSTTTRFFYNDWQEIEEQNQNGVTVATYVYGGYIDEVINMQRDLNNDGTLEDYFYHTDDLYNVVAVTNALGSVVERYDYQDYGAPEIFNASGTRLAQSAIQNPLLFNGRRFDAETGLYYYRNRYLDARAGRFISRDKIGMWGDSLNVGNAFSYVGNNPATRMDPMGLWSTGGHNKLLDIAFGDAVRKGKLPQRSLRRMKEASFLLDILSVSADATAAHTNYFTFRLFLPNKASNPFTHQHYMAEPSEAKDTSIAKARAETFINNWIAEARKLAKAGSCSNAAEALGYAFHTIMDSSSPMHVNEKGEPRVWGADPKVDKQHSWNDYGGSERKGDVDVKAELQYKVVSRMQNTFRYVFRCTKCN